MNQNNFINSNKMEQNPFVLNQQIVDQFYLQQLCGGGNYGQTFSEKFSKPRPMSYKQNQSVLLKKEIQNQKNQSSKFHNMTKLLMYTFLQMFQQENLESLGLPDFIQVHLKKLARNIKLSGKKPKGPNNGN
ncbi:hypothetical protein PPERSA_10280 [Pseudocohnilembus persalinus]|uniref:Uncharacterized protein n=1 Tax=Pseudocohnilembus persalinus TaxID=266149 RepID=A0A0V0R049_PSEPJ|nr:hypothetical protein PPERSA_10280 [Pseudocohnilembus persalinus]|eukprot:KRX07892.1 hypothetical protein PPERSA_10280 [Pseudocohnilembus persalinus]